jgi:hypothetical protein
MTNLGRYAARLSAADRAAMESGSYCKRTDPRPRKERKRKPAPPHVYRATRVYSDQGITRYCQTRDCQDKQHALKAALGFDR